MTRNWSKSFTFINSYQGLAWLGGACWKNPDIYYGASVNADKGGFYDGTYTV